jgi:aminoglycoside phosphotransferase family enzyme
MVRDLSEHQRLVRALLSSDGWPHATDRLGHIETHISSVLLVGPYAYKIKKPVDFGFLDFSTVDLRRVSCEEEVRLNRRLAPDIYIAAMPITGTLDAPVLGGAGEPIDWAVKMRRFDEGLLLSAHPELLDRALMERLGRDIAKFHAHVNVSQPEDECGQPDLVVAPMRANFEQIRLLERGELTLQRLQRLEDWTEAQFAALRPLLEARKLGGVVREGHGDLHLGNIAMDGPSPIIFDGIEFSCQLRCIDVMNDIAFLAMDLQHQRRPDLEAWFINAYVEESGDYAGLPLLRFYQVYRAMVRAKVATLRLSQIALPPDQIKPLRDEFDSYIELGAARRSPPAGCSGRCTRSAYAPTSNASGWPVSPRRSKAGRSWTQGCTRRRPRRRRMSTSPRWRGRCSTRASPPSSTRPSCGASSGGCSQYWRSSPRCRSSSSTSKRRPTCCVRASLSAQPPGGTPRRRAST